MRRQVAVRLEEKMYARILIEVAAIKKQSGVTVTVSDLVRAAVEARYADKRGAR
jgi:hypothetical protein